MKKSAALACDWEIPPAPQGHTFDDCGAAMNGWHYDNLQMPTRVFACPQTCDSVRKLDDARIRIKFGCKRCSGLDANCGREPPPKPPELL